MKPGEYGLVVCVWVCDGAGHLLLTKRATEKKSFPNTWENSGGSAWAGESSRQAIARELYEETIHWISESEDSWKNFLSCMGRLYQLDFLNTCMVYAQRPDASVLAGYDAWLEMDLPVARGSKGIAVFPSKIFGEGVTHVYDIQDVKGQGIRPWNWQVNGTNRRLLARELFPEIYEQEKKFKNSLDAFTRTNVWFMIEEEDEILKSLQKLAVLIGEGQEVKENQITEFLVNSVCYAVKSRCGIRDDTLDFSFICCHCVLLGYLNAPQISVATAVTNAATHAT